MTAEAPAKTLLIDTDVHEAMKSGKDLLPYLAPVWQVYITDYGWSRTALGHPLAYALPKTRGVSGRADWILPDRTTGTDLEAMQKHLFEDEHVSHAILSGIFHVAAQRGHYEFAQALGVAYNDWQIATWLEKDKRIFGSVHVAIDDPVAAAREIDRVAEHPQIVQVFLPMLTHLEYGDPRYVPIFEAAVRNNLTVTLHHGSHTETLLGYPRSYLAWHTMAAPQAGQNQLLSMICGGLFDRLPDLKVVLLETGVAWLPWFMWRLDQQYRELRSEVPWVKRLPSEHMRDSVRISTQPMTDVKAKDFTKLVEMTESDRMFLFATDYPHYDADSVDVLNGVPEPLQSQIRYQNALETFPRLPKLVE